ncbi:hypothetical protein KUCAC02_014465, partial [Chaenocephalus aceratus]
DKLEERLTHRFESSLVPPGHYEFGPVCSEWSCRHTHVRAHRARVAVAHCGSRLVQLLLGSDINTEQIGGDLQPLLFDLSSSCHISWHGPLPHRVAQAGLAWPQRACQVCSLSSSPSNLFPYARSMDPVLQITRAPLPPATARIQETFNPPVCLLQKAAMLPRPAM